MSYLIIDIISIFFYRITGGELFERVIDDNFELDEATCEKFMREILQGVEYIHSQRVIHLDLKVSYDLFIAFLVLISHNLHPT